METIKGETKKLRKISISWELPNEKMADGRPFSVQNRYTFSAAENANLRKALESWRGKKFTNEEIAGFDVSKMLGKACVLTLETKESEGGKTFTNILSISPPMKGTVIPTSTENEQYCFAMVPEMFNPKLLEKMHEKLQETIKKSPEWNALSKGQPMNQSQLDLDDEIPF